MKDGPAEDAGESSRDHATPVQGKIRGIAIFDLMARFLAAAGTFGSAVAMGTTDESLTLFTQFQVRAKYNDLPALTFFVIANSIVSGYLVLSLPISVFHIIRSKAKISRIILVILDTVMLTLLASGASAAAAIVYLAHKGNASANWAAICQQVDSFCKRISGSLIGSFGATILFILTVIASASALSRCS